MAKIRTNQKVYRSRHGQECFISREMINFNQDKQRQKFISIVREQAFLDEEVDVIDPETGNPFVDENGDPTGQKEYQRKLVEDLGTRAHNVTYAQVNGLFQMIGQDIVATGMFVESFHGLQETALKIDTQTYNLFATDPSVWIIDDENGL